MFRMPFRHLSGEEFQICPAWRRLRQTGDRLQGLHLPSCPRAARYLAEAAGERAGLPLEMTFDPDPHKHRKNRIMCKVILGTPPLKVECI